MLKLNGTRSYLPTIKDVKGEIAPQKDVVTVVNPRIHRILDAEYQIWMNDQIPAAYHPSIALKGQNLNITV